MDMVAVVVVVHMAVDPVAVGKNLIFENKT